MFRCATAQPRRLAFIAQPNMSSMRMALPATPAPAVRTTAPLPAAPSAPAGSLPAREGGGGAPQELSTAFLRHLAAHSSHLSTTVHLPHYSQAPPFPHLGCPPGQQAS